MSNRGCAAADGGNNIGSCFDAGRADCCCNLSSCAGERTHRSRIHADCGVGIEGIERRCINAAIRNGDRVGIAGAGETGKGRDVGIANRSRYNACGIRINGVHLGNRGGAAADGGSHIGSGIDRGSADCGGDISSTAGKCSYRTSVDIDGCFGVQAIQLRGVNRGITNRNGIGVACACEGTKGRNVCIAYAGSDDGIKRVCIRQVGSSNSDSA